MENNILEKLHNCEIEILDEVVRICEDNELDYFLIGGTLLGAVRHKGFIPWDDDLDIGMPRKDYNKLLKIASKELKNKFLLDCHLTNKNYYLPFAKVRNKNTIFESQNMKKYIGEKGIWIDIFPLDNASKQESIKQNIQVKLCKQINQIILKRNGFADNIGKTIIGYYLTRGMNNTKLLELQQNLMQINKKESSEFFINIGSNYNFVKQTIPKEKYYPITKLEFEKKLYNVPRDYDYVLKRIFNNYMQLPSEEKRITHNPIRIKFENEQEIVFEEGEK